MPTVAQENFSGHCLAMDFGVLNDSNDPIYGYLAWVDVLELLEQIKNL